MDSPAAVSDRSSTASVSVSSKSMLRYPLRSAKKLEKPEMIDTPSSLATRRIRQSTVSQSLSAFDFSGKEKSSGPRSRLSIPNKHRMSQNLPSTGSVTPTSQNRPVNSNTRMKCEASTDISKSTTKRRFCALSSVSYWLSQVKLSEAAGRHLISLGFFKLAMESGCESLQRLRDELKSYTLRYNLVSELGESARELLQSYNILEDLEALQVSESHNQPLKDGIKDVKEDKRMSLSAPKTVSLKPKPLNYETPKLGRENKREMSGKIPPSGKKASQKVISGSAMDGNLNDTKKNANKTKKLEFNRTAERVTRSTKKDTSAKDEPQAPIIELMEGEEDKENQELKSEEVVPDGVIPAR